jgi:hypothetical protein
MDLFIQATNGIHKTAILLDRIADVYPDMDWSLMPTGDGNSDAGNAGKIGDQSGKQVAQQLADSYDKTWAALKAIRSFMHFCNSRQRNMNYPGQRDHVRISLKCDKEFYLPGSCVQGQIRGNRDASDDRCNVCRGTEQNRTLHNGLTGCLNRKEVRFPDWWSADWPWWNLMKPGLHLSKERMNLRLEDTTNITEQHLPGFSSLILIQLHTVCGTGMPPISEIGQPDW